MLGFFYFQDDLISKSQSQGDLFIPTALSVDNCDDLVTFEGQDSSRSWSFIKDKPLESRFDLLCDSPTFHVSSMYFHLTKKMCVFKY